jgi:hypothetical protein
MATNDITHDYALRIDGPLLAKQRQWLLELSNTVAKDDQDVLEGVVALLDEIADQAHDQYGIASLLESRKEVEDGSGIYQGENEHGETTPTKP